MTPARLEWIRMQFGGSGGVEPNSNGWVRELLDYIGELQRGGAVVVPELTKATVEEIAEAEIRVGSDGPFASREQVALAEIGAYLRRLQTITTDRLLGEGMVGVDQVALEVMQAELDYRRAMCDEAPDDVLDPLWEAFDALRSAKGGVK